MKLICTFAHFKTRLYFLLFKHHIIEKKFIIEAQFKVAKTLLHV